MPAKNFQKTILKNGVRVVTEKHPHSKAISIGFWILTGSRDEGAADFGVSHFLEHLVFKGTKTKSAFEIAKYLEQYGGDLNAFTTKEYTCYHALVLSDHWKKSCEILSDLVCNMSINNKDFTNEKGVILQEIGMSDDEYEEQAMDIFFEKTFKNNPLGRPILGDIKSVSNMKLSQLKANYKVRYSADQIIVTASGNLDHEELAKYLEKLLKNKKTSTWKTKRKKPQFYPVREVVEKETEQVQFLLAWPTVTFKSHFRFEAVVLSALLGGGMSSRLFQSAREKKGLVYNIESNLNTFTDVGIMIISGSGETKNIEPLFQVIKKELLKIKENGVSKKDLEMFKTQICGTILLGSDEIENRMTSLAVNEMIFGKYKSVEQVIEEINKVSVKSMNEFIKKHCQFDKTSGLLYGDKVSEMTWWKDYQI